MCEVVEGKGCVSFHKGKYPDKFGNSTYLMRAGHHCKWFNNWVINKKDRPLYKNIKKYLIDKGCKLTPYKNDPELAHYVTIKAKGLILAIADKKFIVFDK